MALDSHSSSPNQLKQTECPYRSEHPSAKAWEHLTQWCQEHERWECDWHLRFCEEHHRFDCHDKVWAIEMRAWLVRERYIRE